MESHGGLLRSDGVVDRTYAWKPLDGTVELALATAARERARPEAVSQALAGALALLDGEPATRERVDALSVPERRVLMVELAQALAASFLRSTHACEDCGKPFHISLDLARLPLYPDGPREASAVIATTVGCVRVRVPTGADQIRISHLDDDISALRLLVALCMAPAGDQPASDLAAQFSAEDFAAVDATLDDLTPNIPWAAEACCPECRHLNIILIDAAAWLAEMADGPTDDVHEIAMAYGWSERDILALTRTHRLKYLALIRGGSGDMQAHRS
jgi:hypothetical protein